MSFPRSFRARAAASGAILLLAAGGCAPSSSTPAPVPPAAVYPGTGWERVAAPEAAGWSSAGLDSVRAALAALPSTGFMAVVGGRVLLEYGDVDSLSYLASVRKSVLSMLFGNYVASRAIRLERTLADIGIDDIGGLTPEEKRATVRDLLMARSGVYHAASNGGDDLASAPPRGSQAHGTYYLYNNWDFNALGTIFERATGRAIYDAFDSDLARPLGMQDWRRDLQRRTGDTTRSVHRAYHLILSTRDMARIGYLMLREGNWNGRQLVPRTWVRESTRALTPVTEMNPAHRRAGPFGYGYLWWAWDGPWASGPYRGAFTGLGAVGQHITVLPALDLVVAHKTAPGGTGSVTHPQYLEVLDLLVRAHCGASCLGPPAQPATAQAPQCGGAQAPFCSQVRRLLSRPEVRAAFVAAEGGRERARQDLVALTQIPAPPFGEAARGRAFAALLLAAGADSVYVDSVGNVIALRRGLRGDSTVVLAGHLDTVFPEGTDVTVRQRGDTLFAPGIGDDTRGLVVVLEALRALEAARLETRANVLFVGTVGEEGLGDLRGAKHLFRAGGPRIDSYIGIDGGDDAEITSQALGSVRYRVRFRGPGGHSWGAFGTANPIHAAGRGVALFAEAAAASTAGPRTSFNVGRIGGGTSINSIPFEAWFETDMRSESPEALQHIDSVFRASMLRALAAENHRATRGDSLTVELERAGERPSGETPTSAPLLQRALAATALLGQVPELDRSSTDANVPIARGIPAITIGRGGEGGNNHSPDEWWRDVDSHLAVQRALLILLAEAGLD